MCQDKSASPTENQNPVPLTEERGLQPAKNTPPMPQVKPTKSESSD